jgi:predicted dehydrogenase
MSERCVVVGAGGISGAWFPPLKAEGIEVAAVVDLRIEAARKKLADFDIDCPVSDDLKGTLKRVQPDFVVDLTTPDAHAKTTCTALRAGFLVIGEKPMASSMAEARRMVKCAEESGKLYMVASRVAGMPATSGCGRPLPPAKSAKSPPSTAISTSPPILAASATRWTAR